MKKLLIFLVAATMLVSACAVQQETGLDIDNSLEDLEPELPFVEKDVVQSEDVNVRPRIYGDVSLDNDFQLRIEVTPSEESGSAEVMLELPPTFKYVSGDLDPETLTWTGSFTKDETTTINTRIKGVQPGDYWAVKAVVRAETDYAILENSETIYISLRDKEGSVTLNLPEGAEPNDAVLI